MTYEAWLEMTPKMINDTHKMTYIEWNTQWWVLEIFDGLGSHISGLLALELREVSNIFPVKEEGNQSHMNQAYDKFYVNKDNKSAISTLYLLWI